jgi:hypothetical protein
MLRQCTKQTGFLKDHGENPQAHDKSSLLLPVEVRCGATGLRKKINLASATKSRKLGILTQSRKNRRVAVITIDIISENPSPASKLITRAHLHPKRHGCRWCRGPTTPNPRILIGHILDDTPPMTQSPMDLNSICHVRPKQRRPNTSSDNLRCVR